MVSPPSPATGSHELRLSGAGLELAATCHGACNAPATVLFAHGFGQTRRAWTASAARVVAQGYRALAYDARGHGGSDRNPADQAYTAQQFIDDLIVVAGELPQPPVLVAASMGGLFGLSAEARWPGLFRAMVLVDITPRWEPEGMQRILGFITAFPDGFASLDAAADAIGAYLPGRARKSEAALREVLRQQPDGRWHWHWDRRLVDELARDGERHQEDLANAARAVRCPLMLLSGGRSDLVSDDTVTEFLGLAPHARHVRIAGATHMLAGDDNDRFTATLLDYLGELDGMGPTGRRAASCDPASVNGAFP